MAVDAFVCPECNLKARPAAFYVSEGQSWWSASPAEAAAYRHLCRHRGAWRQESIVGCPSMRQAIDPWLGMDPPAPRRPGEVPIADIAAASRLIEARADVPVPTPPRIGDSFRDPVMRAAFALNPGSAEIKRFDVHDVVLDAARLLLLRDGNRIAETRYLLDDGYYWIGLDETRPTREIDTAKTVVIGVNTAFRNHYHWLMQCLPAIDHSLRTLGPDNCVLALPRLTAPREETLAMLGHADVPRIEIEFDCLYRFRRASYCTWLNGSAEDHISPLCLALLDRLAAQVEQPPDVPDLLYVSRLDSGNRVIENEDEVRRLLEARGFVTLVPGYLPLRTQIALFRQARAVVGAHGAGLTNLAFCRPGTAVLELVQSTYPILFMNRIAQGRGLRYHAECFECVNDGDVHKQRWTVDLTLLASAVERLI